MLKEKKLSWTSSGIGNQLLSLSCSPVWNSPSKKLFYLKLGCNPNTSKIIEPRTRCVPFSSSSTNCSLDPGPKLHNFQSKNPSELTIPLLAGLLQLALITVSIWLVCGTDHPSSLPEPDSAHYRKVSQTYDFAAPGHLVWLPKTPRKKTSPIEDSNRSQWVKWQTSNYNLIGCTA